MSTQSMEIYDKIMAHYTNFILCELNMANEFAKLENEILDEYMKDSTGKKKIKSLYGDRLYLQTASDFNYTITLIFDFDTEELSKKYSVAHYIREKLTFEHVNLSSLEFSTNVYSILFTLSNYTTYIKKLSEYLLDNLDGIFSSSKIDENILEKYKDTFTNVIQEHDTRIGLFENIITLSHNIKKLICKEFNIST